MAVDLAGEAGLVLDPWEEYVLQHSLRRQPNGQWAAREVGLCVPRQNGKDAVLEARELTALFIDERDWPDVAARLIIHSAHNADTAAEHFLRLSELVENNKRLRAKLRGKPVHSHGSQGLTLRDGRRIRFRTRTKGGGRGFSCDLLVLNEAMTLPEAMLRAIFFTLSARPNPQIWYTGSPVDQEIEEEGVVFSRVRQRGIAGDEALMYAEYSVDADNPDMVTPEMAVDQDLWAQANPGLDIRIDREFVALEQRSLGHRSFAIERLGVGDWPDPESAGRVIDPQAWLDCRDEDSSAEDPVCLAFDVTPDRARSCIAAAGWRQDGLAHIEVIKHGRGTAWVAETLASIAEDHRPVAIICDARSAAGALLPKLEDEFGLRVTDSGPPRGGIVPLTATEHARGCGILFDAVEQRVLRHLGDPKLDTAVAGAAKRPLSDAFAWDKRNSTVDISPLVACTFALYGLHEYRSHRPPEVISLGQARQELEEEKFEVASLPPIGPEDL